MTITKDDVDTYGADLIRDVQRFAQPEVDRVGQQVTQLQSELRMTQTQLNRQRSIAGLDADREIGSTWHAVNEDPAFIRWTKDIDPLSNQLRIHLLQQAFDMGDHWRSANIFKAYLMAKRVPAAQRTEHRLPDERRAGLRPTARGEVRVFTRAEINRFYRDCRSGLYADREAERLQLETQIVTAAREGRVEIAHLRMPGDPV